MALAVSVHSKLFTLEPLVSIFASTGSAASTRGDDVPMATTSTLDIPRGQLSFNTDPLSAIKLLQLFLMSWSRLESLKRSWGCRRLGVDSLTNTKIYKAFGLALPACIARTKFDIPRCCYSPVADLA